MEEMAWMGTTEESRARQSQLDIEKKRKKRQDGRGALRQRKGSHVEAGVWGGGRDGYTVNREKRVDASMVEGMAARERGETGRRDERGLSRRGKR